MRKLFALIAVCALFPFALAACGGDDEEEEPAAETTTEDTGGGGGGGATVSVEADPGGQLAYVQKSLSGSAGEITFEFDNPSSTEHDFCVEDGGETAASGEAIFVYHTSNAIGCTDVITGETTTLTENLDAGEYTFYCSVSGHREAWDGRDTHRQVAVGSTTADVVKARTTRRTQGHVGISIRGSARPSRKSECACLYDPLSDRDSGSESCAATVSGFAGGLPTQIPRLSTL